MRRHASDETPYLRLAGPTLTAVIEAIKSCMTLMEVSVIDEQTGEWAVAHDAIQPVEYVTLRDAINLLEGK